VVKLTPDARFLIVGNSNYLVNGIGVGRVSVYQQSNSGEWRLSGNPMLGIPEDPKLGESVGITTDAMAIAASSRNSIHLYDLTIDGRNERPTVDMDPFFKNIRDKESAAPPMLDLSSFGETLAVSVKNFAGGDSVAVLEWNGHGVDQKGQMLATTSSPDHSAMPVALSSPGDRLAMRVNGHYQIYEFDYFSGRWKDNPIALNVAHFVAGKNVDMSSDGRTLCTVWSNESASKQVMFSFEQGSWKMGGELDPTTCALSSDGKRLVTADESGSVQVHKYVA
jgi:WD40 repeat protein